MKIDNDLLDMFRSLAELKQQKYEMVKSEVNYIINNKIKDEMRIERALDELLDLCDNKNGLLLYKKLCKYYYSINPQATIVYINTYNEFYDSEELKN